MNRIVELGATDDTANFILKVFSLVIALIVTGTVAIAIIEIVKTGMVAPWVATLLGGFGLIITTLLTVNHTTQVINGTATKSATQTVESLRPTLDAAATNANINAVTIQQVLQAMTQINTVQAQSAATTAIATTDTAKVVAQNVTDAAKVVAQNVADTAKENTVATHENTQATHENTQAEKGENG